MDFIQGIAFIKSLPKTSLLHGNCINQGNLKIFYPGYKGNNDYKVEMMNGKVPTHYDICLEIYNSVNSLNYNSYVKFIEDVYTHGLNSTNNLNDDLKNLIYWVSLQEDINYPPPKKGRNLAFCRYYEAILSKQQNTLSLETLKLRCNNHTQGIPTLYNISNTPIFYK
ncbi:MAG: hypothetical protein ACRC6U_04530 [Fusobacteriaceae bacterium]